MAISDDIKRTIGVYERNIVRLGEEREDYRLRYINTLDSIVEAQSRLRDWERLLSSQTIWESGRTGAEELTCKRAATN